MDGKLKKPDANSTYPSPCIGCEHNINDSCKKYMHCDRWLTRYRYRQKQINAYARNLLQVKTAEQTKFVYQHPDVIRRYLADGPCKVCKAESVCDTPCPAYLRLWDARMQITRKKVGV